MNNLIKITITILVLSILGGFLLDSLIKKVVKTNKRENHTVNLKLGKRIVLDKDTLTIVDHSSLFKTYTLSNNIKVSEDYIDNLILLK
jgi:hypothetical protein